MSAFQASYSDAYLQFPNAGSSVSYERYLLTCARRFRERLAVVWARP